VKGSVAPRAARYAEISNRKTLALAAIAERSLPQGSLDILVVGCGAGDEAGVLARYFKGRVVGIDIGERIELDPARSRPAKLVIMDAERLGFRDVTFDLAYSFHVLEHVANPLKVLREMSRVLRGGGTYCIGTPNRSRWLGYLGAAEPWHKKAKWNIVDLLTRLRGRWQNEEGAHAGFAIDQLLAWCREAFGPEVEAVSEAYYLRLYPSGRAMIRTLTGLGLDRFIFPSIYVCGRKRETPTPAHCAER
jgi:SAM-dependent methyltransferase